MPERGPASAAGGEVSPHCSGDDADFASLVGNARTVLVNRQAVFDEHQGLAPAAGAGREETHRSESGGRTLERDRICFHFAPPHRVHCKRNAGPVVGFVRARALLPDLDFLRRFRVSSLHSQDQTRAGPLVFPGLDESKFSSAPRSAGGSARPARPGLPGSGEVRPEGYMSGPSRYPNSGNTRFQSPPTMRRRQTRVRRDAGGPRRPEVYPEGTSQGGAGRTRPHGSMYGRRRRSRGGSSARASRSRRIPLPTGTRAPRQPRAGKCFPGRPSWRPWRPCRSRSSDSGR